MKLFQFAVVLIEEDENGMQKMGLVTGCRIKETREEAEADARKDVLKANPKAQVAVASMSEIPQEKLLLALDPTGAQA